jgi:WASH complex subunit 7
VCVHVCVCARMCPLSKATYDMKKSCGVWLCWEIAGLDVLDVVRRMREFAATYCYSLASQLFVERAGAASGSRQLNTLTPSDVTAAIRAHGPMLADVAATRAAVFLSQRLLILSQVQLLAHT